MKLLHLLILVVLVIFLGALGFSAIERHSLLDSIYWVVITLSTVGYGDYVPTTQTGKIFTALLIVIGWLSIYLLLHTLVGRVVTEKVEEVLGLIERDVDLKDHYIICGYGKIAEILVRELEKMEKPFVVIEKDEEKVRELTEKGIKVIHGDALSEETLKRAGIDRAKGLASTFGDDAENVFLTVTAKDMNSNLRVVVVSNREENIDRLYRVGADRVISPKVEGGRSLARALISPILMDFIDRFSLFKGISLFQIKVKESSPFLGKSIRESGIKEKYNGIVIAVMRGGEVIPNPDPDFVIEKGDNLLVFGKEEGIRKLEEEIT